MRLTELLPREDILVGFHAADKWDALDRVVQHLAQRERIPRDRASDLHEALLARERSMSTGMERGLAIPHAAVEGLEEVVGALAIVGDEGGLAFESIDASPAQLLVVLLIPRDKKLLHIRTLADVARVLGEERVRQALLKASDSGEAWHVLEEGDRRTQD